MTGGYKQWVSAQRWRALRRRHTKTIGRIGWALFGGGIAVAFLSGAMHQAVDWGWFSLDQDFFDVLEQIVAAGVVGGILCGLLTYGEAEERLDAKTSERLQQVMARFDGLDVMIRDLGRDVQEMTKESAALELRASEAQTLLRLSQAEKSALIHEWDRRDKASSRRDLLFFAAGLAAGVVTNLLIP